MKRVSIKPEDRWFSFCVRHRASWRCERCGSQHTEGGDRGLHCSHFIDRRFKPTRWHPRNCNALCMGCHEFLGKSQDMYREWLVSSVRPWGVSVKEYEEELDKLRILSLTTLKNSAWIRAVIAVHYKTEYKRMMATGARKFTNWTEAETLKCT